MSQIYGSQSRYSSQMIDRSSPGFDNILSKLSELDTHVNEVISDIKSHTKKVKEYKSEKETLDIVLTMKVDDVEQSLTNEKQRIDKELNKGFKEQQTQNDRM